MHWSSTPSLNLTDCIQEDLDKLTPLSEAAFLWTYSVADRVSDLEVPLTVPPLMPDCLSKYIDHLKLALTRSNELVCPLKFVPYMTVYVCRRGPLVTGLAKRHCL